MQKGILAVNVNDVKIVCCCESESDRNRLNLYNWGKCVFEVDAGNLGEFLNNDADLTFLEVAFGVAFDLVDLFKRYCFLSYWQCR